MTKPGYQAISKDSIPVVSLPLTKDTDKNDNGDHKEVATARVIAGTLGDTKGAARTFSPVQMWDVQIPQGQSLVDLPFPPDQTCIVFVRRGSVMIVSGNEDDSKTLKESTLGPQDVALMHMDGSDLLRLKSLEKSTSVLILGGEPIDEPIAAQGPFVMNTQEEIRQAMMDYRMGKMGN
jgi:quercetin 2,3-dioxygenase